MARRPSENPTPNAERQRTYRERQRRGVELGQVELDADTLMALEVIDPSFANMDRDQPEYHTLRDRALRRLVAQAAQALLQ
jgi:hypothetical protein